MDTFDQMLDDHRYLSSNTHQTSNKDDDDSGLFGRRVYLESPSFGNQEEEDLYRYVPSRLSDHTTSVIGATAPARTGATLMDSLDFELNALGANNTHPRIPYRTNPQVIQESKPAVPSNTFTHIPRADPRQDPLLGPLLAELDAMSNQQQQLPAAPSNYRRNSTSYEPNLVRPPSFAVTNAVNRTVNDALLEDELYDSLNPRDQQQQQSQVIPFAASNINSSNYSQPQRQPSYPPNMNGTDIFVPSSYTSGPGSFLSHFGPEDQLFQKPSLNSLGQNYVPNLRPPPSQQRNTTFDQTYAHHSPPQRPTYNPPHLSPNHNNQQQQYQSPPNVDPFNRHQIVSSEQHYEQQIPRQMHPSNNQETFFADPHEQNPPMVSQRTIDQQDQNSKGQAVWNQLQRTNSKAHEKAVTKRESTNRGQGTYGSNTAWNNTGSQQSSALSKSPQRHQHHPPPVSKPNHVEENIDMIKNKENFYHRYPTRRYENAYATRKDLPGGSGNENSQQDFHEESKIQSPNNSQHHTSLPVTINLNSGEGSLPGTVTIPVDSHIHQDGDKISVNIDLRLVDLQNLKQQQQSSDHPHWSGLDPLNQHIRKLERNIERSLPPTHPPQRSPVIPNTGANPSMGRYGKMPSGTGRGGYNPPMYGGDYYNSSDKGRDEDSYLAKMNYAKKSPQFKPYTGRDYEQFKKNYGFGTGYLGSDFNNTTYKEKTETFAKTRVYAQQVEARNKKKISAMSHRTLSDTRIPTDSSKTQRSLEYARGSTHPPRFSGTSTRSSPPLTIGTIASAPTCRPTEALNRLPPIPRQPRILPQYEDNEVVERFVKSQSQGSINPSQKRKKQLFDDDNRRVSNIERPAQDRTNQRRLSPPKNLHPTPLTNSDSKRRPLRFDKPLLPDEPSHPPPQQSNIDQLVNRSRDEKRLMQATRQELTDNGESVAVE